MLSNPNMGQEAQVWYRKSLAGEMPLHGKVGKIVVICKGKPRNHGIMIDGQMWVVPCGNLRPVGGHRVGQVWREIEVANRELDDWMLR